jgi:UDP-N-acetylmuramyl pentapeptide phosphotransferase/UDP-N-acetylglucosamine-1-phosphate transferase
MLRLEMLILSLVLIFIIIRMVNKNIFSLKKSSPWLLLGIACLFMVIFPDMVVWLSNALSFKSPMNFLFFGAIVFLLLMQILNTYLNTRRDGYVKMLVQEISLLKAKIKVMEKKLLKK